MRPDLARPKCRPCKEKRHFMCTALVSTEDLWGYNRKWLEGLSWCECHCPEPSPNGRAH